MWGMCMIYIYLCVCVCVCEVCVEFIYNTVCVCVCCEWCVCKVACGVCVRLCVVCVWLCVGCVRGGCVCCLVCVVWYEGCRVGCRALQERQGCLGQGVAASPQALRPDIVGPGEREAGTLDPGLEAETRSMRESQEARVCEGKGAFLQPHQVRAGITPTCGMSSEGTGLTKGHCCHWKN